MCTCCDFTLNLFPGHHLYNVTTSHIWSVTYVPPRHSWSRYSVSLRSILCEYKAGEVQQTFAARSSRPALELANRRQGNRQHSWNAAETESRSNMRLYFFVCCRSKKGKKKRERSRIVDLWNRQQQVAGSLRYYTEIRMLKSELISAILLCKKKKKKKKNPLPGRCWEEAMRFHITQELRFSWSHYPRIHLCKATGCEAVSAVMDEDSRANFCLHTVDLSEHTLLPFRHCGVLFQLQREGKHKPPTHWESGFITHKKQHIRLYIFHLASGHHRLIKATCCDKWLRWLHLPAFTSPTAPATTTHELQKNSRASPTWSPPFQPCSRLFAPPASAVN